MVSLFTPYAPSRRTRPVGEVLDSDNRNRKSIGNVAPPGTVRSEKNRILNHDFDCWLSFRRAVKGFWGKTKSQRGGEREKGIPG